MEKKFRITVDEFSAQFFETNNILKYFFYGRIPLSSSSEIKNVQIILQVAISLCIKG